jgi:membrane protein implicated in regulation of membrane protease activity
MMTNNILETWLILGVAILILEIFSTSIILLFVSLAAILVGGLIYFDVILETNFYAQLATFLIACFAWAILLWIPMTKLRKKIYTKKYNDVVGSEAVLEEDAKYAKYFKVKWSGVSMQAKIDKKFKDATLKKGDIVKITAVNGNKLTVSPGL